jgi:hypothetical protein
MAKRRTTMLTVDAGPDQPARFYRLMIATPDGDDTVTEELLVPDGDELKITHRLINSDKAA